MASEFGLDTRPVQDPSRYRECCEQCRNVRCVRGCKCVDLSFDGLTSYGKLDWSATLVESSFLWLNRRPMIFALWRFLSFLLVVLLTIGATISFDSRVDTDNDGEPGQLSDGVDIPWLLEITHMSVLLVIFYFASATALAFYPDDEEGEWKPLPYLARITWALHTLALPSSFLCTLLYWMFLRTMTVYHPPTAALYTMSFLMMTLDTILGAQVMLTMHSVWLLLFGTLYALWTFCHYQLISDSQAEPYRYIYSALNWAYPAEAFGHLVLMLLLAFMSFLAICKLLENRFMARGDSVFIDPNFTIINL